MTRDGAWKVTESHLVVTARVPGASPKAKITMSAGLEEQVISLQFSSAAGFEHPIVERIP